VSTGNSVEIARKFQPYKHYQTHIAIRLCVIFNSENVYREFLYDWWEDKDKIEIHASGREWLHPHYLRRENRNKSTFYWAAMYRSAPSQRLDGRDCDHRNILLIRQTLPKRVEWKDVVVLRFLKDEDRNLFE